MVADGSEGTFFMNRHILIAIVALLAFGSVELTAVDAQAEELGWIVGAQKAKELIEQGEATVLDTRGGSDFGAGHAAGAQPVSWQDFSRPDAPHKGELLEDAEALTAKLRALGVSKERPVLVVGKPPDNWGEDGRIVWMLRTLGHSRAALVDGGNRALREAKLQMKEGASRPAKGDFEARLTGRYAIDREALRALLEGDDVALVDTREEREFAGKTPYGESRGGHIPGAKHMHYTDLMRPDGRLLPEATIRKKLAAIGVTPDKEVVAYCTGGVRSAWVVVVLAHLGYGDVANYAGSMWEWAASPAAAHPLAAP
jgi:thiosulfate/3-mercaptopyruvate sulfurtransferase